MCSTFGCIVFISMTLAVLLPKMVVAKHEDKSIREKRVELQRVDLESENAALHAKINELASLSEAYARQLRTREADPRNRLPAELVTAIEKDKQLAGQRDKLAAELAQQGKLADANARKSVDAKTMADELDVQVAELEKRASTETTAEKRRFRLPQMRATGKAPVWIAIKNGRMYYVTKVENGRPQSPPYFDGRFVEWREPTSDAYVFTVKPGTGFGLDDGPSCARSLSPCTDRAFRQDCFLHFWVFDDSYPEFVHLKDKMCELGISYNWTPKRGNDPIGVQLVHEAVKHEVQ